MKIVIETIPSKAQRYFTLGDYWRDGHGVYQIRVSGPDREAIAVHELTEMLLCLRHHISFRKITAFDKSFKGKGEPGDDPKAPYHREHRTASVAETIYERAL